MALVYIFPFVFTPLETPTEMYIYSSNDTCYLLENIINDEIPLQFKVRGTEFIFNYEKIGESHMLSCYSTEQNGPFQNNKRYLCTDEFFALFTKINIPTKSARK